MAIVAMVAPAIAASVAHADDQYRAHTATPASAKDARPGSQPGRSKPHSSKPAKCAFKRLTRALITAVPTATTLTLDDGTTIKLQSVLAPSALDVPALRSAWPMAEAAHAAVAERALGRQVEIAITRRKPDRYGRRPAHVWLIGANGKREWLQQQLLDDGLVRFAPYRERQACANELVRSEAAARRKGHGMWALSSYAVRPAARPFELLKYRNTFQIVAGRVVSANEVRGRVYLNFARNWREDFTAVISKRQMRYFRRTKIDPLKLTGAIIRIRGWIERRGGPLIKIEHTHQIEIITPAGRTTPPTAQFPRSDDSEQRADGPARAQPGTRPATTIEPDHEKRPERLGTPGVVEL